MYEKPQKVKKKKKKLVKYVGLHNNTQWEKRIRSENRRDLHKTEK